MAGISLPNSKTNRDLTFKTTHTKLATIAALCLTLLLIGIPSHVECTGSNSNDGGNLTFADLPAGEAYEADVQTDYFEGDFPLPTTWQFIESFLKTISPAPPPYELINDILGGSTLEVATLTDNITKFQGNLMGFAICFVLGALFIAIFPIVCLCFCCCRCCNNCGGKMYQEQRDSDRCKRVCFAVSLVIVTAIIAGGIGTAYSVNTYISGTVETLPDDVIANIDDMVKFVNNTLAEVDFLVTTQLSWTLDQLTQDLRDIDVLVGEPVRDELNTNVGPAIAAIYPLAAAIDNTYNAMAAVNTTQNDIEPDWEAFVTALNNARSAITADCGTCGCCSGGSYPDESTLTINADYRDATVMTPTGRFPQLAVDTALGELETLQGQDLTSAADIGARSFEDIPETLRNTTTDDIDTIIDTLDQLEQEIPGLLNETTSQLSVIDSQVEPIKGDIDEYGTLVQDYDMYRVYAVYCLYAVFVLIVLLNVLGLMCGWCGYDKDATPTLRGGVSNCGGLTLMSAAGISMIFATFYMLFTTLTFIIGGPIDRLVCDPIVSRELFTETIDKPDAIIDGYYLGNALFKNSSIPLTVSGILDDCENNVGAYSAFKLEYFLNISDLLNFNQFIPDVDSQFANISGDFSSIEIITDETIDILTDFRDSSADEIDWSFTKDEFDSSVKALTSDVNDGNDLSVYAGLLRTFANTLTDPDKTTFLTHADTIDDLQTNHVDSLLTRAAQLVSEIGTLEGYTSTIDTTVNNTIAAANTAQDYLDNNVASLVANEVSSYTNRILGYPEQYVQYALTQVTEELGRCAPIANLWNSATRILCRDLLESFNAIWLTLGWCTIFLMPSIIFGIKLAKHYRIMDYEDGYDDYLTPHEMEMAHMNQSPMYPANKVAPGHV